MNERALFFNGIDAETGDYLLPGMSSAEFAALARRSPVTVSEGRGVKAGVIPEEIESAGWGVVFPYGIDPKVRQALRPLIEHRRSQVASPQLFKELFYRPGTGKRDFLRSFGSLPAGPVDPAVVPYYLLLVGDPRQIPYSFQYDLAVQYAVGRLSFDTPEEYALYAESVVESETREARRRRKAVLFAARHPDDPATADTAEKLVRPLSETLPAEERETVLDGEATKTALGRILGGDRSPALLFTVSHGLGFNRVDHPLKTSHHGALVTSDWPGPGSGKGPLAGDECFAAADLGDDADVAGMVTFHLACWTAGTPELDYFLPDKRIAEHDFIARLPQRLLAHPGGGALAVIGHVDRAWLHTFLWKDVSRTTLFESVLAELMGSVPVGRAMRYFGETSADLANDVLSGKNGANGASDEEYSETWVSYRDARSYLILGDPAVRLRFAEAKA